MKPEDKKRFAELILLNAEAYGKEVGPALVALLWDDLKEFSIEHVEAALSAHRRDSAFFPRASEIIDQIMPGRKDIAQKTVPAHLSKHPALIAEHRERQLKGPAKAKLIKGASNGTS